MISTIVAFLWKLVRFACRPVRRSQCCLPRKECVFVLVAASIIFTGGILYFNNSSTRWAHQETLQETVAVMQTRLKFLESQFGGKMEELYNMQALLEGGYDQMPKVTENDGSNTTYSASLEELLQNMSAGSKAAGALSEKPERINFPFSLHLMPHLLKNPKGLRPAYHLSSKRKLSEYIIGVPHVKRDKETYLYGTIRFLLQNLSERDINSTQVVVMVGETDMKYVIETAHNIEKRFSRELKLGLIEVISPAEEYYPDFTALAPTLGDSPKRARWRTKQNLDAIFLMAFAQSRCLYYLMIEDDVIAEEGYITAIQKFTASTTVSNPGWFFIQYSTIGGIGKLFRSTDLIHFITYVQLFYDKMPIDWLTESYLADRVCGINKGAKDCADAKTKIRPTYPKNLFKHVGLFSSLKGKIQKVKDTPKATIPQFFPHENPPLEKIKNDLGSHDGYTIEKAYAGESFFWGSNPKKGDVIEFWFKTPTKLGRYMIRSGNFDRTTDKIYNASVEVLSNKPDESFVKIDQFDEFGLVEGHLSGYTHGDLLAIRINFEAASKYWVIVTEIEFVSIQEELDTI